LYLRVIGTKLELNATVSMPYFFKFVITVIILFAQQYSSMHICTNTILEEQDSKVRYEH